VVDAVVLWVFLPLWLLLEALWKFVVGWLFGLFQGPELWPLEVRLRPSAPFRVSFWVAFHGCSLEHTDGGCQCWELTAEGYRAPTREEMLNRKQKVAWRMSQVVPIHPLWGARAGLFIGEVKRLITMP
jgi:hypothetical protein